MALAGRPRLLLLDEPAVRAVRLRGRPAGGVPAGPTRAVAVLLVEHRLDLVYALCDQVTVLRDGRTFATGTPAEIRASAAGPAGLRGGDVLMLLWIVSAPATPAGSCCTRSPSTWRPAPCRRWWAATAPARAPSCTPSPGWYGPCGGRIEVDGVPVAGRQPHRIARCGVGLVPQGRRVFSRLTVAEHLALSAVPWRAATPAGEGWTVARVLELLPRLAARLRHRGDQLSGGEQQMLAIARALLGQPRVLLLDEPCEGLAPGLAARVRDLVGTLARTGLAVFLVEQQLQHAVDIADRIAVLKVRPGGLRPPGGRGPGRAGPPGGDAQRRRRHGAAGSPTGARFRAGPAHLTRPPSTGTSDDADRHP